MSTSDFPSPAIPGPGAPCICGKNKRFGQCCGSRKPNRKPPTGVVIKRAAIGAEQCDKLVRYADKRSARKLLVGKEEGTQVASLERESTAVDLGDKAQALADRVSRLFRQAAQAEYGVELQEMTYPMLMRYEPGGYYHAHADSEIYNPATRQWERRVNRDISLLLYLNDDYSGGELKFHYFNYQYKPRKGDLVLFPSDHRYLHEATIVTEGIRYVVVCWGATHRS